MNYHRQILHNGANIYEGVIARNNVRVFTDIEPLYCKLKDEGFKPESGLEVGSWCGASAIRFASIFQAPIVCVDTWLGSEEHWLDKHAPGHEMHFQNGRPRLYEEFLESTCTHQKFITPLPLPSATAAKVLMHHGIKFDLIYLDGDHTEEGVRADIEAYSPLLRKGGYLIGDDLKDIRFGVLAAVEGIFGDYEVFENNWWLVRG